MKIAMKRLIRDEKGAAMVLAVILLLVGGLIAAPLLAHMGTGVIAGEVYERRTAELYAADAGVEYAIWGIQNNNLTFDEDNHAHLGPLTVNGRSVQVEIYREDLDPTCGEELRYQILSTAVTDDGGGTADISGTAIESYVSASYMDFSSMLDNAIVSDNNITIYNGVNVTGNVTSGGTVDDKTNGDVDGTITENADLNWPSSETLSAYYFNQVEDGVHYDGDTEIDLEGQDLSLGPLYVDGELDILNSNDTFATLTLTGTIYITGDTLIGQNGKMDKLTLDLNGQTIFVESSSVKPPKEALYIGGKCNIIGPGCIIAVGDVYFAPKGDVGSENDFVLVMSVEGTTTLRPSGTFYGCIAGNLCVDAQSGEDATIINSGLGEGQDLNFPMGIGDDPNELPTVAGVSVESWEISQQ